MLARVVVRTELTDINEGSVLYTLCATVAEQIAEADIRLVQIRDQFTFDGASGSDLDERVEELGLSRLGATTATGTLTVGRTDTTEAITLTEGSTFGRTDSDVTYATTEDYTLAVGVATTTVNVAAQVTGTDGNAPSGAINIVLEANGVDTVTQQRAIANGKSEESDSALRTRARRFMNSLARCQPSALEYQALTFVASDNTRASTATVYENPAQLGRVEILIDDGNGIGALPIEQVTRIGANTTYLIANTGIKTISIERAVATAPTVREQDVTDPNNTIIIPLVEGTDYVLDYGRGTIAMLKDVAVGNTISVTAYRVFTGLLGELQAHIEGEAGNYASGYRPAGISVRVLPAPVVNIDIDILIVATDGANLTTLIEQIQSEVTGYLSSLGAGEPAYIARIIDFALISNVQNVTVYRSGTNANASDFYAPTPRTVIRAGLIRVVTSITGA